MKQPDLAGALHDLGCWLDANRVYLGQVAVIGGYAAWLYRYHDAIQPGVGIPLLTEDVDVATPQTLTPVQGLTIAELSARAGFRMIERDGIRRGQTTHRFEHGRHEPGQAPVYVEFIAALEGRGEDSRGDEVTDRAVQKDLRASTLRFVELLRAEPLVVDCARVTDTRLQVPTPVQVAHPAGFVLHKARIRDRRATARKKAKDMAYIADVARNTRALWPAMRSWIDRRFDDATVKRKWVVDAAAMVVRAFESPGAFGAVESALIYRDVSGDDLTAERAFRFVRRMVQALELERVAGGERPGAGDVP